MKKMIKNRILSCVCAGFLSVLAFVSFSPLGVKVEEASAIRVPPQYHFPKCYCIKSGSVFTLDSDDPGGFPAILNILYPVPFNLRIGEFTFPVTLVNVNSVPEYELDNIDGLFVQETDDSLIFSVAVDYYFFSEYDLDYFLGAPSQENFMLYRYDYNGEFGFDYITELVGEVTMTRYTDYEDHYNSSYQNGLETGYRNGYNAGYREGEDVGYVAGRDDGYSTGYIDGITAGSDGSYSFEGLFAAVIDVPVQAFMGLLNFELLGVNLAGFLLALLTIAVTITILKYVGFGQ